MAQDSATESKSPASPSQAHKSPKLDSSAASPKLATVSPTNNTALSEQQASEPSTAIQIASTQQSPKNSPLKSPQRSPLKYLLQQQSSTTSPQYSALKSPTNKLTSPKPTVSASPQKSPNKRKAADEAEQQKQGESSEAETEQRGEGDSEEDSKHRFAKRLKKTPPSETSTPYSRPRRTVKPVERLSAIRPPIKMREELIIEQGKGQRLGDIPNVEKRLSLTKSVAAEMKLLFRACFPMTKAHPLKDTVKSQIREFSGYITDEQAEAAVVKLEKAEVSHLKLVCGILDINHSGSKSHLIESIVEYLKKPHASGGAFKPKAGSKRKPTRTTTATSQKKRRASTSTNSKKSTSSDEEAETEEDGSDDSDDNKPLKPKSYSNSTQLDESTLTDRIKSIIAGADLEHFTLKDVKKALTAEFGEDSVNAAKEQIKQLVQQLINEKH